mmetsp:Transcript_55761/g.178946  ORF Transcript_55761/g.178946 Transcript_55761/m.178946 type:complete len:251 (+) Transcript_55761:490-1242(+)
MLRRCAWRASRYAVWSNCSHEDCTVLRWRRRLSAFFFSATTASAYSPALASMSPSCIKVNTSAHWFCQARSASVISTCPRSATAAAPAMAASSSSRDSWASWRWRFCCGSLASGSAAASGRSSSGHAGAADLESACMAAALERAVSPEAPPSLGREPNMAPGPSGSGIRAFIGGGTALGAGTVLGAKVGLGTTTLGTGTSLGVASAGALGAGTILGATLACASAGGIIGTPPFPSADGSSSSARGSKPSW